MEIFDDMSFEEMDAAIQGKIDQELKALDGVKVEAVKIGDPILKHN